MDYSLRLFVTFKITPNFWKNVHPPSQNESPHFRSQGSKMLKIDFFKVGKRKIVFLKPLFKARPWRRRPHNIRIYEYAKIFEKPRPPIPDVCVRMKVVFSNFLKILLLKICITQGSEFGKISTTFVYFYNICLYKYKKFRKGVRCPWTSSCKKFFCQGRKLTFLPFFRI